MQAKKRILFFPFDLLAHYLRCIVLANEFYPKNEYEVLFLSSKTYNTYIEKNGYKTFDCEQFNAKEVMDCAQKFDFSWLNQQAIERIFISQYQTIKLLKADSVVGDVAPTLKMAAELAGVEYIACTNAYMTNYYAYTRKLSITHKAYSFLKLLPEKYIVKLTDFAEKISFKLIHKPFAKLRAKYNLKKVENYIFEMEGDKNLLCDSLKLFPQNNLPSNYSVIGPLLYKSNQKEGDWLANLINKKPMLVVCMGSTGNWNDLIFLNDIYFSKYAIITAGDTNNVLNAKHIVSRNFVNLEEVLSVAQLMICHGGNGTIYNGIQKSIYMLCLTANFEQEWNVQAIERIGFGKSANGFSLNAWKENIEQGLKVKLDKFF